MGEEEVQFWYYMVDGAQVGPVPAEDLQQLALQGIIHAETELWTEGLDQWIPATHVEGLLPAEAAPQAAPEAQPQPGRPQLVVGAAAQAAHPLAGEVVPQAPQVSPDQAAVAQPVAAQPVVAQPVAAQEPMGVQAVPAQAAPAAVAQPVGGVVGQPVGAPLATAVQPGMDYPPTGPKRASYGLLIGTFIGALVVGVCGVLFALQIEAQGPESASKAAMVGLISVGVAGMLLLFSSLLSYMYLYRAWKCLRFGSPRTTAGKAVGFMFIPLFNIYWFFVAFYGLAQDWNRITASHPNLQGAPRMNEGLFLTFIILSLAGGFGGLILWFIIYKQICDGVNFMAIQSFRQQRPAGMSFY